MGVEIKICGLTNRDDALYALEMGADHLGFILYAGSPRGITSHKLFEILDRTEEIQNPVGVFVNAPPEDVIAIVGDCALGAVQLHGDEDPDAFSNMTVPAWRAVRMREGTCLPAPETWTVDRYLVDADVPGQYGGTGQLADWHAASEMAMQRRVMLSGGLTAAIVAEAIARVRPLGVDVSSGVEVSPGIKDKQAVRAFIEAARNAVDDDNGDL